MYNLYLYKYSTGYICLTETEKNDIEYMFGIKLDDKLIKINNEEEFKICIENREFKKSDICIESRVKVSKYIKQNIIDKSIYLSDFSYDLNIRPVIQTKYGYIFPILEKQNKSNNDSLIEAIDFRSYTKYILKVRIAYDKYEGHMFLIVINLSSKFVDSINISSIDIVDTGPIEYNIDAIKTLINNFFSYPKDMNIQINVNYDENFFINYPIYDSINYGYLQNMEKTLINSGYCVAWTLFFIWYKFVEFIDFDEIYSKLFSLNDIEKVILIMIFWDNISNIDKTGIKPINIFEDNFNEDMNEDEF